MAKFSILALILTPTSMMYRAFADNSQKFKTKLFNNFSVLSQRYYKGECAKHYAHKTQISRFL